MYNLRYIKLICFASFKRNLFSRCGNYGHSISYDLPKNILGQQYCDYSPIELFNANKLLQAVLMHDLLFRIDGRNFV